MVGVTPNQVLERVAGEAVRLFLENKSVPDLMV
jgi:hypothetical protein